MKTTPRQKRIMRHNRVRALVSGTAARPRLSVYKSNADFIAQVFNDEDGTTMLHVTSKSLKDTKGNKTEKAQKLGELLAKSAVEKGIKEVTFDRGGFAYHGRVKAFAEAARGAGLKF